jgi:YidC/Oxa1 family membrane protein insertase
MAANAVSNGMAVFKPLYWLFGKCMEFLLDVLNNQYFIALIIFTVVTRLLLLPLNVKQQKSMAATTRLQPKIQKINKKYPDPRDRDKLNREMQELYAREGHNPMQMGCGPMIFQMVFLMGVIGSPSSLYSLVSLTYRFWSAITFGSVISVDTSSKRDTNPSSFSNMVLFSAI